MDWFSYIPHLIFGGLLLLIFAVGWFEASGSPSYRFTWRRLLRGMLPIYLILALPITFRLFELASEFLFLRLKWDSPSTPIFLLVCLFAATFFAFVLFGVPILALKLTTWVIHSFAPDSPDAEFRSIDF